MNTSDHAFPLPENEAHKLDEIRGELPRNRVARLAQKVDGKTCALAASAAVIGGLFLVLWLRQRRR